MQRLPLPIQQLGFGRTKSRLYLSEGRRVVIRKRGPGQAGGKQTGSKREAGDEAFGHARIVVGRFRYAFDSAMRFHSKDLLLSN